MNCYLLRKYYAQVNYFRAMHIASARTVALSALLLLSVSMPLPAAQRGALTVTRSLPDLVAEAGVIVRGQIASTRVEPHPQFTALWTVLVTVQVDEAIKGQVGSSYAFRQFLWDQRDREAAAGCQHGQ